MKYHRVLYTHQLTPELKSKLRIISYNKRRSLKGNVYYVTFGSDEDMKYADRISRRLRNITLKPFHSRSVLEDQSVACMENSSNHSSSSSSEISSSSCTRKVSNMIS